MTGDNRTPSSKTVTVERVNIDSVDVANQSAVGRSRTRGNIHIDTSHYVGGIGITPTVGDQWYVSNIEGVNRLHSRIPFNDPNQSAITPTQGQHVIGSGQGPIELQGTIINANAPLNTQSVATAARPSAASLPAGTQIYDVTIGKPIWTNGSVWHDSTGATV